MYSSVYTLPLGECHTITRAQFEAMLDLFGVIYYIYTLPHPNANAPAPYTRAHLPPVRRKLNQTLSRRCRRKSRARSVQVRERKRVMVHFTIALKGHHRQQRGATADRSTQVTMHTKCDWRRIVIGSYRHSYTPSECGRGESFSIQVSSICHTLQPSNVWLSGGGWVEFTAENSRKLHQFPFTRRGRTRTEVSPRRRN